MKRLLTILLVSSACALAQAQARYDLDRLATEKLDRGLVAVRQNDGQVFLSWRTLRTDQKGEPFDIYRDGKKLNDEPLTTGGTCFVDQQPPQGRDVVYEVRGGGNDGHYTLGADAPTGYLAVRISPPNSLTPDPSPRGERSIYQQRRQGANRLSTPLSPW